MVGKPYFFVAVFPFFYIAAGKSCIWRAVFGAAAICLCVMAVIWILGFGKIEKCGKDPEEETADVDNDESTAANTVNAGKQEDLPS